MAKSLIHIRAVKENSEVHNYRKREYNYVRKDLTPLNENFAVEFIKDRKIKIEENCKRISGRKLQKNAEPIREGVVLIEEHHTIDDLHVYLQNWKKNWE